MLTWITFSWVWKVIFRAYKGELTNNDVWNMDEINSCKFVTDEFEKKWNFYIER